MLSGAITKSCSLRVIPGKSLAPVDESLAHTELLSAKNPGSRAAKLNFFIKLVSVVDENGPLKN
ncbi:hypothetical protein nublan010_51270 [Klebsiella pneumoniae]|nr:hypothetical protein NUBL21975_52260 [Klebsiella pneumoniae]GKK28792.1 hypothetical protein NUBL13793_51090 [Klebsiella pneumoniae]GKK60521.1 hypothetical protein NUBL13795_27070 [Klebsiella pneumoniae]GKL14987.1 hypothetical protein NUBL13797_51650 [Klebsiella pneumoniae]GKL52095.1 hypothetical protein NUBL13453_48800 [Klebsiella pneumoniae]